MNKTNDFKAHKCTQNNINIDDVAYLCYKIGKEIWGEDHFLELMEITKPQVQSNHHLTQTVA
ncbi:MAG: hypothetical protein J5906_01980 [Acidaminococcaceae bacterium]|nr:hypothetical protein [Acidaminococcaceae bacterium]